MNRSDPRWRARRAARAADKRGRGVGTALLTRLTDLAVERGFERAGSHVAGADERSIAFARRFGFEETRRDVKQVLELEGTPRAPRDVDGVEFVSIESRPELLRAAWPVAQQGYEDMPIDGLDIRLDSWLAEEATLPGGSFAALAADEIVGYAGLMRWDGEPTKAEHGLTVVSRDWRRSRRRRGAEGARDRVGGGERHPRAGHVDADGQREHAGRQHAPRLRHDGGRYRLHTWAAARCLRTTSAGRRPRDTTSRQARTSIPP
jgi:RimJ/RimL family protein N-acetyltransferase